MKDTLAQERETGPAISHPFNELEFVHLAFHLPVWEATTGIGIHGFDYTGQQSFINSISWSPDGNYIASGAGDGTVQVRDATSGNLITDYTGHSTQNAKIELAWSPNGKFIASKSLDSTIQVWEAVSGKRINIIKYTIGYGEGGEVYGTGEVAWSPDGKRLVSGDGYSAAKVWDATTGNILLN